jgi:hypothetical protein
MSSPWPWHIPQVPTVTTGGTSPYEMQIACHFVWRAVIYAEPHPQFHVERWVVRTLKP